MAGRWAPGQISVVVPTYNRVEVLLRVLAGLERQTVPPDRFEVLVVDDGSTDATAERVATYRATCPYRLTLLTRTNAGPAAARNAGLRQATGDIVVFTDDDCLPEPTLLSEHLASHTVEGLAVIGHIDWHPDLPDTPFMAFVRARTFSYALITLPYDAPFACFYSGNVSVHRAAALAVGGFEERFPRAMHEDIEFAYRLRRHGVRFVYNERARVLHYRASTYAEALPRERLNGREVVRLWRLHPELADLLPRRHLVDAAWRRHCYRVLLGHALVQGIRQALGMADPDEPDESLPAALADEGEVWADPRARALLEALEEDFLTRGRPAALARLQRAARALHEHLSGWGAAFAARETWAASLIASIEAWESAHRAWEARLAEMNRIERRLRPPPAPARPPAPALPPTAARPDDRPAALDPPDARRLSVILTVAAGEEAWRQILGALEAQTLPHDRWEVLLVGVGPDAARDAALADLAASTSLALRVLPPAATPAAAWSAGIARAGHEVVLLLSDACTPTPTLLAEHLAAHVTDGLAVLGAIGWEEAAATTSFSQVGEPHLLAIEAGVPWPCPLEVALFSAHNASVWRADALATGGLDADLPPGTLEELEFAYRLHERGVLLTHCPTARVLRRRPLALSAALEEARRRGRAAAHLAARHPALATALAATERSLPATRTAFYEASTIHTLLGGVQAVLAEQRRSGADDPAWRDLQADLTAEAARLADDLAARHAADAPARAALAADLGALAASLDDLRARVAAEAAAFDQQAAWTTSLLHRLAPPA